MRRIIGIAGAPGSGKSTLAGRVAADFQAAGGCAVVVPLDGFHLADVSLERLGLLDRKGAPETFDPWGYLRLLERLRTTGPETVYAPGFERTIEQPIAAAIAIEPDVELIVTEGNYLLLDTEPWVRVRSLLDERWFIDIDAEVRRSRLQRRHVAYGKSPEAAAAWVERVDEPNARLIEASRHLADRIVSGA